MTTWQDFKTFFSSAEQDYVTELQSLIQSAQGIYYFSEAYPISDNRMAEIIGGLSSSHPFYVEFADFIFSNAASISVTGTDEEQWTAYIESFSKDYQEGIRIITGKLKATPYSYTFSDFKTTSSGSEIATILHDLGIASSFFKTIGHAFNNRIRQATDTYNILESFYSGDEKTRMRELLFHWQTNPKYKEIEKFIKLSKDEIAADLWTYFHYYSIPRYFLDFLIDELKAKIDAGILLNLTDEQLVENVFSQYSPNKRKSIEALYYSLKEIGATDNLASLSTFAQRTGVTDIDFTTEYVLGFNLQPNSDFSEKNKGWYSDIYGNLLNEGYINDEKLRLSGDGAFSSFILTSGKNYVLKYNVVGNNHSTNQITVKNGSTVLEAITNPTVAERTINFTAVDSYLSFTKTAGSGDIDIDTIRVYEKLLLTKSAVITDQEASSGQPQISFVYPYNGNAVTGDKFLLYINNLGNSLEVEYDGVYANSLTNISDAINDLSAAGDGDWAGVTATVDTDHIVVTATVNNVPFTLSFLSLKEQLLRIPSNHDFYKYLALDIIDLSKEALKKNTDTFKFLGKLINTNISTSTAALTVMMIDLDARPDDINLGSKITDGDGNFSFDYQVIYPAKAERNFKLEVYKGDKISDIFITHIGQDLSVKEISISYYAVAPAPSPSISTVASTIGLTIPTALQDFLDSNSITKLSDIRNAGGLKYMTGLPVAQDSEAVVKLDAHATMNLISGNILANEALIVAGHTSPFSLASETRAKVVTAQEAQNVGSFNASKAYYLAKAFGALTHNLVNSHLASSANNHNAGKISELDPIFEPSCNCKDCSSAVSPLAYLTDLLNYTLQNVKDDGDDIDLTFLQDKFYLEFGKLPHSCESGEHVICQQRLAVEVLRKYIAGLDVPLPSDNLTQLTADVQDYCFNIYKYALRELGTSFEQVRAIKSSSTEEKAALAAMLSFPYSETFDPFTEIFISESSNATEAKIEELFGIPDTTRDNLSTGVKSGDAGSQITRWIFKGVKFLKNTDKEGFVYVKIVDSSDTVLLYKDADVANADFLVGTATASGILGRLIITPENESGLSGELYITTFTDNTGIKISVLPKVMCWRLSKQRELWKETDFPANDFKDGILPVIDPDIIGPDDFRIPDPISDEYFKIWKKRRDFVDDRLEDIRTVRPVVASMLSLMSSSYTYTDIDSIMHSHNPWSVVPTLDDLKDIYFKLRQGDSTDIATAKASIAALKLTVESFVRLYEIYNATSVNDERGLMVKLQQAASGSLYQITRLIPNSVKAGDKFTITYNLTDIINYTAATDDITDLLNAIKTAIEADSWTVDVSLSSNEDYLLLTGQAFSTTFQVTTKVFRAPSEDAVEEVVSILTQSIKQTFNNDWLSEEVDHDVTLNSDNFWPSIKEPIAGSWPVLASGSDPMIDPEFMTSETLPGYTVASTAQGLLTIRIEEMLEVIEDLRASHITDGLEKVFEDTWGSLYLGSYSNLDEILFDLLNPADPAAANVAEDFIVSDLYMTAEEFRKVMEIREKSFDQDASPVTSDEWNTLYSLLGSSYKKRVKYPIWYGEESSLKYWEVYPAALPVWRSSNELRNSWKKGFEIVSRQPIVDPDLVRPDFLLDIDSGARVFELWNDRKETLDTLFNEIKTTRETAGTALAGFDLIINTYIVTTTASQRLIDLYTSAEQGKAVEAEVAQLNLTFESLGYLLVIRSLLVNGATVLDEEWESVYSIIVQVQKSRTYSLWLSEEESEEGGLEPITLSPDYFQISDYARLDISTATQQSTLHWRVPAQKKRDWEDVLKARINTEESIIKYFSDLDERIEDQFMGTLRDALIQANITDNTSIPVKASALSEKLLIDLRNNCCLKMTRVSQAIEALQILLFSIRNGLIQDDYPDLTIESDHFDEEWKWIGSYADWRSAMFVNLYPENVLHPALRQRSSSAFSTLVNDLRDENQLTPESVLTATSKFYVYFSDLASMKVVGHASATTIIARETGVYVANGLMKDMQFLFGLGGGKRIYWTMFDGNDTANFDPVPWQALYPFAGAQIVECLGASNWQPSDSESYLLFFARIYKEGKDSIGYAKFDLFKGVWEEELVALDIPSSNNSVKPESFNGELKKVLVNKPAPGQKVKNLVLAIHKGEDVKFFKLNGKGNDLEDYTILEYLNSRSYSRILDFFSEQLVGIYTTDVKVREVEQVDNGTGRIQKDLIKEYTVKYYQFMIGNTVTDLPLDWYLGSFTWVDGDGDNSNNITFLFFKKSETSTKVYYRLFLHASNTAEIHIDEKVSTFVHGVSFISLYLDNKRNVYSVNQTNKGIEISPIYKTAITYKTLAPSFGPSYQERNNNILAFQPDSPVVKFSYTLPYTYGVSPYSSIDALKTASKVTVDLNSNLPKSFTEVITEGFYFVPVLAGLSLQSRGYYTQALDWFRLVYSYDKPENATGIFKPRKIWYGLIQEEKQFDNIKRSEDWLKDPLNPHAVAQTRAYSYTKYTVLSIVKCLLDFADSEFTKDTSESVPRARVLYEAALELLDAEGLRSRNSDCLTSIEDIDISSLSASSDWYRWYPLWIEIVKDLEHIEDKDSLTALILLIETELSTGHDIEQKLSYIRDVVDDALEAPDQFEDYATVINKGRYLNNDAMLRMLKNPDLKKGFQYFFSEIEKHYVNAVTGVTGITHEALYDDTMYLSWFGSSATLVSTVPGIQNITNLTGTAALDPYFINRQGYYNPGDPSWQQIQTLTVINNPIKVINQYFSRNSIYTPKVNPVFCVPPNPILNSLMFAAEANLFKIRNCMNIASINRELLPYAAPSDQMTGLPVANAESQIISGQGRSFQPSIYRFEILIERAKQQVNIAQQLESTLLNMYEKSDQSQYDLLQAKQHLQIAKAGLRLQNLRMVEAQGNIDLALLQRGRVLKTEEHFNELLNKGLLGTEMAALVSLTASTSFYGLAAISQTIASGLFITAALVRAGTIVEGLKAMENTGQAFNAAGSALTSWAQAAGSLSSLSSMLANYQRRKEEWQFELALAQQDLSISNQQITLATERYNITDQERQIAQLEADHAAETIDFLSKKFTNKELYDWMSGVLQKVYSYFLYQANATAKIAQNQLAFERQEEIPQFIQDDYWTAPSSNSLMLSGNGVDRRGLTSSARLLKDIAELDQYSFETEKRKLQLTKTISLLSLAPAEFQRFRETGIMTFKTTMEMFDRDFPGHYLRLVKKVKTSVIALIPPVDGIKATLRNPGISYVVNGNDFKKNYIVRPPDSVSLSAPMNATGLFELNEQQSGRLNPFENIGVESTWEFVLPKASNFFDFSTIADVLITFEYTALESRTYRNEVIANIGNTFSGDRAFSFKNSFADQWYDLSNPDNKMNEVTVTFNTTSRDFPANLSNKKLRSVSMFFSSEEIDITGKVSLSYKPKGSEAISGDAQFSKILLSAGNAPSWASVVENKPTEGEWKLTLSRSIIERIVAEEITDIALIMTIQAETPEWPSY